MPGLYDYTPQAVSFPGVADFQALKGKGKAKKNFLGDKAAMGDATKYGLGAKTQAGAGPSPLPSANILEGDNPQMGEFKKIIQSVLGGSLAGALGGGGGVGGALGGLLGQILAKKVF